MKQKLYIETSVISVQAINYSKGIVTPIICTPEELIEEEVS